MITKQIKNQKPTSLDIHLKYRCPNNECEYEHWLSLLETQTKNFKVVCDCGTVFIPKRIKKIKVFYATANKAKKDKTTATKASLTSTVDINIILEKACSVLESYGFSQAESKDLIEQSYNKQPTTDFGILIKNALLEIKNG
jgi:hypothetical protein